VTSFGFLPDESAIVFSLAGFIPVFVALGVYPTSFGGDTITYVINMSIKRLLISPADAALGAPSAALLLDQQARQAAQLRKITLASLAS
jgi:hypothetical protein